jgi:hypothetical protein
MLHINPAQDEIKKLDLKIEKLRSQKMELMKLSEPQRLAEEMHKFFCRLPHDSEKEMACDWMVSDWDTARSSRQIYLNRAKRILNSMSYETAMIFVYEFFAG